MVICYLYFLTNALSIMSRSELQSSVAHVVKFALCLLPNLKEYPVVLNLANSICLISAGSCCVLLCPVSWYHNSGFVFVTLDLSVQHNECTPTAGLHKDCWHFPQCIFLDICLCISSQHNLEELETPIWMLYLGLTCRFFLFLSYSIKTLEFFILIFT